MEDRIPFASDRRARGRLCLRSERGGMLVEVMMSALLVALVATAVFKSIDGAASVSGQSKARGIAASLAQEDLERLRAKDPRTLANFTEGPVDKNVDGVIYKVTSTASWVSDRGGSESCTTGSGRVTYVRINSSVTWPNMVGSKPITESSVLAINNAYAKGSLSVKVVDRNSLPVQDASVNLTSPASSKPTNEAGCAVFDGLSSGVYTGSVSKTGYITPAGDPTIVPVNGWSVTTGGTSVSTYLYDVAGSAKFNFDTKLGSGGAVHVINNQNGPGVTVKNSVIPAPGFRRQTFSAGTASTTFGSLFPSTTTSNYVAYPGTCDANDNGALTGFSNPVSFNVPPGGVANSNNNITLRMPAIRIKVRRTNSSGTTSDYTGADVKITPPSGCGTVRNLVTIAGGRPAEANATDAALLAWPYATGYTVCVDDNQSPSGNTRRVIQTVDNTSVDGVDVTITIKHSGSPLSQQQSC